MGRLGERITRLEAHAEAARVTEEAREQERALSRLSAEDISALDSLLDLVVEHWENSGTFENLHEVVDERGLRAFARFEEVLEAVRREDAL